MLQQRVQQLRGVTTGPDRQIRPSGVQIALGSLHGGRPALRHDGAAVQGGGTFLAQPRDDVGGAPDLGKVEGRPVLHVARRDARSGGEQTIDHGESAADGGVHQRRVAVSIRRIDPGVCREQGFHGRQLARTRRQHQRRHAMLIGGVNRCAAPNEQRHRRRRARLGGARQRATPELVACRHQRRVREDLEARHVTVGSGKP